MLHRMMALFLMLLLAMVAANPTKRSTPPLELVSIIQMEEPCVRQGGLCTRIEDCDGTLVHVRAQLCPMQRHLGVECCYKE